MRGVILIFALILITGCMTAAQQPESTAVIALTGDVMLGRLVNERIAATSFDYPWGDTKSVLNSTDLNIINLETTLTTSEDKVPKVFNFKADPGVVQTLQAARIDVVTLANNHALDFNVSGLLETLEVLDAAGIAHAGAGRTIGDALAPVILERNGIRIGVIGFTDNEPSWLATDTKPGTNYIRVGDLASITQQITALRPNVDILIVTAHWGPNKRQRPTQEYIDFAHSVMDLGVDIFHGHSAHVFQGIEVYGDGIIFFDTGDFVDDYYVTPHLRNDQSFLFLVTVNREGVQQVELVPTLISNMQVNRAQGYGYRETVDRMKRFSKEMGTSFRESSTQVLVELE